MVRSYWTGPLFGVLALTGLAQGQTVTPAVPAKASDSKERYVTVGDVGKPGQKCRVLKTWTMPNGNPAYQVQALDTGELMTIEESESAAKQSPGAVVRPGATHIFHWGGGAQTAPHGSPEAPANAVVVARPSEFHSTTTEPPLVGAAPEKAHGKWPSAFVTKKSDDTAPTAAEKFPPAVKALQPVAPPMVKNVELAPLRTTPVTPKAAAIASTAAVPSKSPYNSNGMGAPAVNATEPKPFAWSAKTPEKKPVAGDARAKAPEPKPANSTSWSAATTWKPSAPSKPPVKSPDPLAVKAPPTVTAKVETMVKSPDPSAVKAPPTVTAKVETIGAQPSDWRESWGKIPSPKPAPVRAEERVTTKAAPKVELPHAAVKTDDPLSTPEKFAAMPSGSDIDSFGIAHNKETKRPFLAMFASNPPAQPAPAPKSEEKKPEGLAVTIPIPPPVPVAPAAAVTPAAIAPPTVKIPPPAPAQLVPPAAAKASPPTPAAPAPVAAEVKPEAKPTAPLGMQSVLAAQSPELAPPAAKKPAGASQAQAMGVDANESNAFTEPPAGGKTAVASNGFWASKKPAPAANPQPEAMAYRPMTPPAGYAPPPLAPSVAVPVAQAEYRPEVSPEVSQLYVVMHESLYPSQREWAAERLASFDWRRQPQALELLMERAKQDAAPMVRAECLRSLGRMKSDAPGVVETVKSCRADADARVRQEADDALAKLIGTTPAWNGTDGPSR